MTPDSQPRPHLPPNFATELWQRHVAHQKRTAAAEPSHPSKEIHARIAPADAAAFSAHLDASTRVLALLGAGLSAASGIPTFRGAGGFWREYDCMTLATPRAHRRRAALAATPNAAHMALAELARRKTAFLAINQNIDGLCERAGHAPENIQSIHGSLFSNRCTQCAYVEHGNFADPLVPAFGLPGDVDPADVRVPLRDIPLAELPRCPAPHCGALLRPDVVWFGEDLPRDALARIDAWMRGPGAAGDADADTAAEGKIDLMIVVGTSALVYPAAGYIHAARARGARVAVFNVEEPGTGEEEGATAQLKEGDWFFGGDAAVVLPELLKDVIGDI
ncbi:putative SIR2 family histone deacetylase [Mycena pura]|uniref:SIR2 family histone deacetylase n=1 Tax=Mycena pura TaxID=153505 RepID=A0AAD6Y6G0_9AGAR|nr:putative SIR2 family histone deacetylase [Mycena pura]